MNNCPKCGNPLQVGVTSCPICGTQVGEQGGAVKVETQTAQVEQPVEVQKNTVSAPAPAPVVNAKVTSVSPAVSPAPAQGSVSNNKVVGSVGTPSQSYQNKTQTVSSVATPQGQAVVTATSLQPAATQVAPVQQDPAVANKPSVQPAVQAISPTPTPSNVAVQTQTPVVEQAVPQGAQVVPSTVQATGNVTSTPLQTPIVPTPGIPTSLTTPSAVVPEVQSLEAPKAPKAPAKKIKINKNVLLVGAVILIMLVGIGLYMMMNSKTSLNKPNIPDDDPTLALTSIVSHGFKFSLQDGWLVNEDSNNVIITNSTETVSIRLTSSTTNFANITEDIIQEQLGRSTNFSNTKIGTTQISARDSYLVNTTLNETLPVQIYLVSGGSALTLGATVIYQTEESKTKFEANVLEIIASISYSDDSIKAISTINMYSEAFNMFNNIVTNKPITPVTPVTEGEENSENPSENNGDENQGNAGETPETPNTLE